MKTDRILVMNGGIPYLTTPDLAACEGLAAGFATRRGGFSQPPWDGANFGFNRGDDPDAVRANYRLFARTLGVDERGFAAVKQVHSTIVLSAPDETMANPFTEQKIVEADAVVSNTAGVYPVCYFADCLPILLYEPSAGCWGAVHAGWRGAAAGIVGAAIERMRRDFGARADKIIMAIGPSICPSCFEVGSEVADKFDSRFVIDIYEKPHVDLQRAVAATAQSAGVRPDSITWVGECTMECVDGYFSHRAHGEARGVLMAAIGMPPRP